MISEKQLVANRRNAIKSTGPKTAKGKAIVSQNALRHGLLSELKVLPGLEQQEDWQSHIERTLADLNPVGYMEEILAERIARRLYEAAGSPQPPTECRKLYSVLTSDQVAELVRQGMDVGSHTVTHARLSECSDGEILDELTTAARDIEEMTGIPVKRQMLSYPLGAYDERVKRIAGEVGHPAAFAVSSGVLPGPDHLYELPRVGISGSTAMASAKVSGLLEKIRRLTGRAS